MKGREWKKTEGDTIHNNHLLFEQTWLTYCSCHHRNNLPFIKHSCLLGPKQNTGHFTHVLPLNALNNLMR